MLFFREWDREKSGGSDCSLRKIFLGSGNLSKHCYCHFKGAFAVADTDERLTSFPNTTKRNAAIQA